MGKGGVVEEVEEQRSYMEEEEGSGREKEKNKEKVFHDSLIFWYFFVR